MEELIRQLAPSAKRFGLSVYGDVFTDALNVGAEALEAGYPVDAAVELARAVLRDASTQGRCAKALTAA